MRLFMQGFGLRAAITGAALAIGSTAAVANDYPSRDVTFVVPMAPGGGVDSVSRTVAQMLSQSIGQPVIVENRPGAGGVIAASYVARAEPDGYTIFVADTGQLSVNPSLYENLPYDPDTSFVPVTEAVAAPLFLAVGADVPVESVEELIEYAKENPGTAFGSTGVGSVHHLGMQLLSSQADLDLMHVPYKGASPLTTALVSGEIPMALSALPSLRGHLDSGAIRLLAVATPERTELMPEVPTIAESGVDDFSVGVNIGFVLPPESPQHIADYLYEQISEVLADNELRERLMQMGLVPMGNTPKEYAANIQADTELYRGVIEASGARVDG